MLTLAIFGAVCGVTVAPAEGAKKPIDVCAMLSTNDVRGWFGTDMVPQQPPIPVPGSLGCDWNGSGDALLTVRLIPPDYYVEPRRAPKYERIAGIGSKAYVAYELHGWTSGAVKGRIAALVQVFGGKSNRDTSLTVLKSIVRQI